MAQGFSNFHVHINFGGDPVKMQFSGFNMEPEILLFLRISQVMPVLLQFEGHIPWAQGFRRTLGLQQGGLRGRSKFGSHHSMGDHMPRLDTGLTKI